MCAPRSPVLKSNPYYKVFKKVGMKGLGGWLSGKVLAEQAGGPKFDPQHTYKAIIQALVDRAKWICELIGQSVLAQMESSKFSERLCLKN